MAQWEPRDEEEELVLGKEVMNPISSVFRWSSSAIPKQVAPERWRQSFGREAGVESMGEREGSPEGNVV